MYIKQVSDLDYGYNKVTGAYDVPSVEWSTDMGTFWERFESEEARTLALDLNEAYNNKPEVASYIKAEEEAEDLWRAEMYTAEIFDYALEQNKTLELINVIRFADAYTKVMKDQITKMVCLHNKLIMRARVQPAPATYTIGDLF